MDNQMANYLNVERETILRFADDSDEAHVNTFSKPFQRKLEKLLKENPEQVKLVDDYERDDYDGIYVTMPKSWIRIRTPMKLTDEQRRIKAEEMKQRRINSKLQKA
jgi:hypothetical protein